MQGIIPTSGTSALESVLPSFDAQRNLSLTLSDAKGLLIGLGVLTIVMKVLGFLSSCFSCFLVQCIFKVIFVFVSFSWSLHGTLTDMGLLPSMWLCSLYSVMPSVLLTIALIGAQLVALFLPLPTLVLELSTLLVAAVILTIVLRYSTQQLYLRMQGASYENSLWNFYQ